MANNAALEQHNLLVLGILVSRSGSYAPDQERRLTQFEMCDAVEDALMALLPADLPAGARYCISQMIGKFTRAVEGGLNGQYHGDNGLDLSGYQACLAAIARADGSMPEDIVLELIPDQEATKNVKPARRSKPAAKARRTA